MLCKHVFLRGIKSLFTICPSDNYLIKKYSSPPPPPPLASGGTLMIIHKLTIMHIMMRLVSFFGEYTRSNIMTITPRHTVTRFFQYTVLFLSRQFVTGYCYLKLNDYPHNTCFINVINYIQLIWTELLWSVYFSLIHFFSHTKNAGPLG